MVIVDQYKKLFNFERVEVTWDDSRKKRNEFRVLLNTVDNCVPPYAIWTTDNENTFNAMRTAFIEALRSETSGRSVVFDFSNTDLMAQFYLL